MAQKDKYAIILWGFLTTYYHDSYITVSLLNNSKGLLLCSENKLDTDKLQPR